MKSKSLLICGFLTLPVAASEQAESPHAGHSHDHHHGHSHHVADEADAFASLQDWSLGGFFFAGVHMVGAGGWVDGDPGELNRGAHDPKRGTFSAQAIEPTLLLRGRDVEAFGNLVVAQDADGDWDVEAEEGYALASLPFLTLKGGQFLASNGIHNRAHAHDLDFVNAPLTGPEFLGEHGLLVRGAEVRWSPGSGFPLSASAAFGRAVSFSHGHHGAGHDEDGHDEHEHEGEHDEHEGDDHDEDDHDHELEEVRHDSGISGNALNLRVSCRWKTGAGDDHQAGVSMATGGNGLGGDTTVAGLDFTWSRNPAGNDRSWIWRNEWMWRRVTGMGRGHEWGAGSEFVMRWEPRWDTGLRVGWLDGMPELDLESRLRISPAVTCWLDEGRRVGVRAQYDLDRLQGGDVDHSVWFQLHLVLGSREEPR